MGKKILPQLFLDYSSLSCEKKMGVRLDTHLTTIV